MKVQNRRHDCGGAAVNVLAGTTITTLLLGLVLWCCPDSLSDSNTYSAPENNTGVAMEIGELR